jgi:hypothetical protein
MSDWLFGIAVKFMLALNKTRIIRRFVKTDYMIGWNGVCDGCGGKVRFLFSKCMVFAEDSTAIWLMMDKIRYCKSCGHPFITARQWKSYNVTNELLAIKENK